MAKGDFVLYRGSSRDPFEAIIMEFTHGPFCHVELDMGDGNFLGEHSTGLTLHPDDTGRSIVFVTPKGDITAGLAWADAMWQEAKKDPSSHVYSWTDIVMDGLRAIGIGLVLGQPKGEWDCSDFITRYLIVAGAAGPLGALAKDPSTVSPNDLARAFNIK